MKLFAAKKRPVLGLDIGASSVKLAGIEPAGRGYRLNHLAIEPLQPGIIANDSIRDATQLAEAIRRAWHRSGAKTKQCVMAVSGASVITRTLYFDASMSETEMESQIQVEAAQHVPYSLDEVSMDFQVTGPAANDDSLVEVLLTASRTENVNELQSVIDEAGLNCEIMDVQTFALANGYLGLVEKPADRDQTTAIIHLGSSNMLLLVMHAGRVLYTREISFGMSQLEQQLPGDFQGGLGALGAPQDKMPTPTADEPDEMALVPHDDNALLETFRDQVIQQSGRALQFFASSSQYQPVDRIMLSGGGAQLRGLAKALGQDQEVDCAVIPIPGDMRVSSRVSNQLTQQQGPALLLAMGLALRGYT